MSPTTPKKLPRIPKRLPLGGLAIGSVWMLAFHPFSAPPSDPPPPESLPNFTWGIAWHPDRLQQHGQAYHTELSAAEKLGVGLLRFDVRWSHLHPQEGSVDDAVLPYFQELIRDARAKGFQVKVNLGSYPRWSLDLLKRDPEAFFMRYQAYVQEVVTALGPTVDYYQMGNEFNTVLDPIPAELDARIFKTARMEIDHGKERWPRWEVRTVINACDTFYLPWRGHIESVLDEASDSIDVIGYDFYPGNYSHLHDWGAWHTLGYLSRLMERYDKDGAICETGCPAFLGEDRQARWISVSTRSLLRAIAASPMRDRFRFAALYELSDDPHPTYLWPPPTEATFGLMAADGRMKAGFEAFRGVIAERGAQR